MVNAFGPVIDPCHLLIIKSAVPGKSVREDLVHHGTLQERGCLKILVINGYLESIRVLVLVHAYSRRLAIEGTFAVLLVHACTVIERQAGGWEALIRLS